MPREIDWSTLAAIRTRAIGQLSVYPGEMFDTLYDEAIRLKEAEEQKNYYRDICYKIANVFDKLFNKKHIVGTMDSPSRALVEAAEKLLNVPKTSTGRECECCSSVTNLETFPGEHGGRYAGRSIRLCQLCANSDLGSSFQFKNDDFINLMQHNTYLANAILKGNHESR